MSFLEICVGQNNAPQKKPAPGWMKLAYKNVVMIADKDVAGSAGNYLIDIPLEANEDTTYAFFLGAHIPVEYFKTNNGFYPSIKAFILIVPDWDFYKKISEDASRKGMCIEPATTNYYYHIVRNADKIKVDSVRISGDEGIAGVNYIHPEVPKNTLATYRIESYGSICCPKDPNWVLAEEDISFIKNYEKEKGILIKGTYRQNNGKEGEHSNYYTLEGLTTQQRLDFMLAKRSQWIVNKATKMMVFKKQLFTPQLVPLVTAGFTKMTLVNY